MCDLSYLKVAVYSIYILLLGWVAGVCPVRIECYGDQAPLLGTVFVIVHMPGFSMGLDYVMGSNVNSIARTVNT